MHEGVEFGGTRAVLPLEVGFAPVGFLDRDARQAELPHLFGGQGQVVHPNVGALFGINLG